MVIPTTGLTFIFGAFVFIYLSRQFFKCYKAENNKIAKYFSYSFLLLGLNYVTTGIPALFLIEDDKVWRFIAPIYYIFISAGWLLLAYTVFSIKFEKYSKVFAVFLFFVFLFCVLPFFFKIPKYYYVDGSLSWTFDSSFQFLFFTPLVIIFILIPTIIFFFLEAKRTVDRKKKIRNLGFGAAMFILLLTMFIDFLLLTILKVHPAYSDLNYLVMFSILAVTLIFSWFPPREKWVTKIE